MAEFPKTEAQGPSSPTLSFRITLSHTLPLHARGSLPPPSSLGGLTILGVTE